MSTSTVRTSEASPVHTALQVVGSSRKPGTLHATGSSSMCIAPLALMRTVLAEPGSEVSQGCPQISAASLLSPSSPRTSVDGAAGLGGGTALDCGPQANALENKPSNTVARTAGA